MKKPRILPGAAGIIALTATIGFVDGQRDMETDDFWRGRITLTQSSASGPVPGQQAGFSSPAYIVELRHGNKFTEVKIDAITGRVLLS